MLPGILDKEGHNETFWGFHIPGPRVWGLLDPEQAAYPLWVLAAPLHCPGWNSRHLTASALRLITGCL